MRKQSQKGRRFEGLSVSHGSELFQTFTFRSSIAGRVTQCLSGNHSTSRCEQVSRNTLTLPPENSSLRLLYSFDISCTVVCSCDVKRWVIRFGTTSHHLIVSTTARCDVLAYQNANEAEHFDTNDWAFTWITETSDEGIRRKMFTLSRDKFHWKHFSGWKLKPSESVFVYSCYFDCDKLSTFSGCSIRLTNDTISASCSANLFKMWEEASISSLWPPFLRNFLRSDIRRQLIIGNYQHFRLSQAFLDE
jgi:hypothetical protein